MRWLVPVLVLALMPLGRAPAATAADRDPRVAARAATNSTVFVRDRRDTRDPHADLVASSLSYGDPSIVVTAKVARPLSPRSRNWREGLTFVAWALDLNRDDSEDFTVVLYNDGYDRLQTELLDRKGRLVWDGRGKYRDGRYIARVPRLFLGENLPVAIRHQTYLQFHRDLGSTRKSAFVRDLSPNRSFSQEARRPPYRTALSISYPDTIDYGRQVTLGGTLMATPRLYDIYLADQPIKVYARTPGQAWKLIRQVRTNQYGTWHLDVRPERTTEYQARYPGQDDYRRAVSAATRFDVVRGLGGTSGELEQPVGHPQSFAGRVDGPVDGAIVRLERVHGNDWATVASTAVAPDGSFSFEDTPPRAGRYGYRFVIPATRRYAQSVSASALLHVYDVRLTAINPGRSDVEDVIDPNNEVLVLHNPGPVAARMGAWRIEGDGPVSARIRGGPVLHPGATVDVRTGRGENTSETIYLNSDVPLWPDGGGTARIYNADGILLGELTY